MQLSVKPLDFISNPLVCAKRLGAGTVYMAVEFLFLEGKQPLSQCDRTLEERSGQINDDLGIVHNNYDFGIAQNNYDLGIAQKLHLAAPRLKVISGRYRDNAVPI